MLRMFAAALGDSINYFWDRYILTFGLGDQITLAFSALQSLRDSGVAFQKTTQLTLRSIRVRGVVEFAGMAVVAILLMAFIARRRRSLFALLAARLHELGIEVSTAMTMEEALNRLRLTHPEDAVAMAPLIGMYEEERFSSTQNRARAAVLRRRLSSG